MANYDNKLGEWFKILDKREKEIKAKKAGEQEPAAQPEAPAKQLRIEPPMALERVVVEEPVSEAPSAAVAEAMESAAVIAESAPATAVIDDSFESTSEPKPISSSKSLFDDAEIPQVEDFFTFLNREEAKTAEPDTFPVAEISRNRGIGHLSEGTGEPRPIIDDSLETPPVLGITPLDQAEEIVPEPVEEVEYEAAEAVEPEPKAKPARKLESAQDLQEKWDRMPHHLQTLFGVNAGEEIAQNSYKTFKENRGELIQRLLDPSISLEEAARILNVCPTTVRRYTNKGVLRHFRTAGNQRRFRLSDVLLFMEDGKVRAPKNSES